MSAQLGEMYQPSTIDLMIMSAQLGAMYYTGSLANALTNDCDRGGSYVMIRELN